MAFVVDRLLPADLDAALALSTKAGWNQVAADWQRVLDLSPEGCLAGRQDGRVVATAGLVTVTPEIRWVCLVLVDEALRGRGYGAAMFVQVLERVRRSGTTAVGLDASDLGRPVYLKQGFVDVAPIDRWTGVLRPSAPPSNIGAFETRSAEIVAALDRDACGGDRGPLLRHLVAEPAVRTVVSPGLGYGLYRPGRLHGHIGPLIAANDTVAKLILDQIRHAAGERTVSIDAMRTAENAALLETAGLTVARRLTRMTLAPARPLLMGPRIRAAE